VKNEKYLHISDIQRNTFTHNMKNEGQESIRNPIGRAKMSNHKSSKVFP
jgi:hypothetical protein